MALIPLATLIPVPTETVAQRGYRSHSSAAKNPLVSDSQDSNLALNGARDHVLIQDPFLAPEKAASNAVEMPSDLMVWDRARIPSTKKYMDSKRLMYSWENI